MKVLKFLNERLEEIFLVVLMIAAVLIVAAQVVTRKLGIPLPWSEEIARYMFLWLTWVGAAYATKERRHVNIDILYNKLPKAGKRVCTIISTTLWIAFLCMMVYLSFKLTRSVAGGGQIAVGSGIPMWVPYASIPVGMTLMLFRLIQNTIHDIKHGAPQIEGGDDNAA